MTVENNSALITDGIRSQAGNSTPINPPSDVFRPFLIYLQLEIYRGTRP